MGLKWIGFEGTSSMSEHCYAVLIKSTIHINLGFLPQLCNISISIISNIMFDTVLHWIHCVVLHRRCQIITQKSVIFLRSFRKNLHWTEKIYTGTALGARDKYQVWILHMVKFFSFKHIKTLLEISAGGKLMKMWFLKSSRCPLTQYNTL